MNNEKMNQIIDEVYKKYADSHWTPPSNPKGKLLSDQLFSLVPMEHSKESFIIKCKTDSEFSKKWGLKIEESELTYSERKTFFEQHCLKTKGGIKGCETPEKDKSSVIKQYNKWFDEENIPTKLITITYNNKTIESYE